MSSYQNDKDDYFPVHGFGIYAKDSNGNTVNAQGRQDSNWMSTLWFGGYAPAPLIFRCPAVSENPYGDWSSIPSWFPNGSYQKINDYGFNFLNLGGKVVDGKHRGVKAAMVRAPAKTIMLADTANSMYAYKGTPDWGDPLLYGYYPNDAQTTSRGIISLRHAGTCNVAWTDGHVSGEQVSGYKETTGYSKNFNPYKFPGVFAGINGSNCHWAYYLQQ